MAFKKTEINYTQDTNTPQTMTDRTRLNEREQDIMYLVRDQKRDENPFVFKKTIAPNSHILFAPITDAHIAGSGFDAQRFELAIGEVSKCFNAKLSINGDAFDNANNDADCKTNSMGNRVRPSEAPIYAYNVLKDSKIKSKILAVLGGNHDAEWGNRNKNSDMSLSRELARMLNVDYIPYAVIYSFPVLTPDLHEILYQNYLCVHDAGGIDDATRLADIVYDKFGVLLDGIFIEHLHKGQEGVYPMSVPVYNENGKRLGDRFHELFIGMGCTFQNSNTQYGAQRLFSNTTNLRAYDLCYEINPYYTEENKDFEPKYKARVTSFNVLSKTENKPSLTMEEYQKYYVLPEKSLKKEKYSNMSLSQISKEIEKTAKKKKDGNCKVDNSKGKEE